MALYVIFLFFEARKKKCYMKASKALTLIKLAASLILIMPLEKAEQWKISPQSGKILFLGGIYRANLWISLCLLVIFFKIPDCKIIHIISIKGIN